MNNKTFGKINFKKSKAKVDYVSRKNADRSVYSSMGFKSGLEVHQQLKTDKKLFCRCQAGIYHDFEEFDAEIIRRMRPTLSELGEYDGTALMEFKTKKRITYRINNKTACTYEIDDTPPFKINMNALDIAIKLSLLLKTSIVGELHITRKQYLDGSIPTGFQRTAIVGVEGSFDIPQKKIRVIQLSIEEDSCREISDIGHDRVYITDRLGMPLIEVVTYPDMLTPDEVYEAGQNIRYLCRSTGLVRTGIGAGREDVNVSITGGTRVEIKGVAHIKWIPDLTHIEAFRQKSLLLIKDILNKSVKNSDSWDVTSEEITSEVLNSKTISDNNFTETPNNEKFVAVNLPDFKGILSHFTQPEKPFAFELENRLKVIACIEKPNMTHSEAFEPIFDQTFYKKIQQKLNSKDQDAQIIIKGPQEDLKTAIETIRERCQLAFEGVPNETRKAIDDKTTIFERVLPGADRMYPDTDSAPISIEDSTINAQRINLPQTPAECLTKMKEWKIPENNHNYILKRNLFPLLEKVITHLKFEPKFTAKILGQVLKNLEGKHGLKRPFNYNLIFQLFQYIKKSTLHQDILHTMLVCLYDKNKFDPDLILKDLKHKIFSKKEIEDMIPALIQEFLAVSISKNPDSILRWIMGELRPSAIGNYPLAELEKKLKGEINV